MDLLRVAVWPNGRDVVRRQLHPDDPPIVGVEDTMKPVVGEHSATEHRCPKRTLRCQVTGVEHDDLAHDPHGDMLTGPDSARNQRNRRHYISPFPTLRDRFTIA